MSHLVFNYSASMQEAPVVEQEHSARLQKDLIDKLWKID